MQPSWKHRKYELRSGGEIVARLEYRGFWKRVINIILDEEELIIRGSGALRLQNVVLRGEQEVARYEQAGKNRRTLTFVNGRQFRWQRQGFWSSRYTFSAPDNDTLITFRYAHRFLRSESIVELSHTSGRYPETRILLAFGWYLMLASAQAATAAS